MTRISSMLLTAIAITCWDAAIAGPCLQVALVGEPASVDDILDRLIATGRIQSIQPTDLLYLDQEMYSHIDALFASYSNSPTGWEFPPERQNGDMFVDLIEDGRGVVIVQGGLGIRRGLWGEFGNDYLPLAGPGTCGSGGSAAFPLPADDPMFTGVSELVAGRHTSMFCESGEITLLPDATVHAYWPNGQPLAASLGSVVAINVAGVSDEVGSSGYPAEADFPNLFVNALYLSTGNDPATACNGDEDDDGLLDEDEDRIGTDWENPDTDDDGVLDGADVCPLTADPAQGDGDGDGVGDACDDDADNDGVPDDDDNCVSWPNADQEDADNDGTGDACQFDADDDGIPDPFDNCEDVANAEQGDADDDGTGDACEPDTDDDGVIDDLDNCTNEPNPDQADRDEDGIGDACERGLIRCNTSGVPHVAWLIPVLLLGYRRRR